MSAISTLGSAKISKILPTDLSLRIQYVSVERVQRYMRDAKSMFDFGEQIKRRRLFRVGVEWS